MAVCCGSHEPDQLAIADRQQASQLQDDAAGEARVLAPEQLEVAVLERARPRRAFHRLSAVALAPLLESTSRTGD